MVSDKKLMWEEKYSVGVQLIDDQHKKMFATINELIDAIRTTPTKEKLMGIIGQLVQYKKFHFATEERYFDEFHYEKTAEHKAAHNEFNDNLVALQAKYTADDQTIEFAFALVDFLEDWLINHLMTADQEYKECFKEHGLK